ncbi:hypothetical protein HYC85_026785 [Camellia sinensis]|uniref:Uncharacterized protein n=1 Tax=Camellia sinensis TaxID=4442 RepID=A0A7J7G8J8_CAMSI|nr:hypothetical protein HYC85_026785 [Camellia sinensis]
MAPEWLGSIITEKVDVYSFGVGPKNLDRSQPEEDMHLLSLFKRKAEEERLIDIIDKGNDEMQLHSTEVVEMMRVAVWCLQNDFSKRSSMSVVVKVLEGSVDVDNNLDYNFINPVIRRTIANAGQQEDAIGLACTLLSPLALSRPSGTLSLIRWFWGSNPKLMSTQTNMALVYLGMLLWSFVECRSGPLSIIRTIYIVGFVE